MPPPLSKSWVTFFDAPAKKLGHIFFVPPMNGGGHFPQNVGVPPHHGGGQIQQWGIPKLDLAPSIMGGAGEIFGFFGPKMGFSRLSPPIVGGTEISDFFGKLSPPMGRNPGSHFLALHPAPQILGHIFLPAPSSQKAGSHSEKTVPPHYGGDRHLCSILLRTCSISQRVGRNENRTSAGISMFFVTIFWRFESRMIFFDHF